MSSLPDGATVEMKASLATTVALFFATAVAEIIGCYLPYLWLKHARTAWLLVPAAVSLALFAWLLTLHPTIAGRTYAAYGGVYIAVALLWMWRIERVAPDRWDIIGVALSIAGALLIVGGPRGR